MSARYNPGCDCCFYEWCCGSCYCCAPEDRPSPAPVGNPRRTALLLAGRWVDAGGGMQVRLS